MKKYLALILAVLMMLSMATGCGQANTASNEGSTQTQTTQPSTAGEDKPAEEAPAEAPVGEIKSLEGYKLGVIDMSSGGRSITIVSQNILVDLCKTTGAELVQVPLTGYDDAAFMTAYESLIDLGCDAIAVSTFSEGPISLIADMMEEAGVRWFLLNRQISDPALKEKVFSMSMFVGNDYCDEYDNAYDMTRELAEKYGVKNLAAIGLTQGDLNGDLRDKAIAQACEDFGITFLTETRGVATVDDVTNAVEGLIASYPELDGIFIVGGTITAGALAGAAQALENHGLSDKVSIAMIDVSPGMAQYMGEGQPLKIVAGGNTQMDYTFSGACLLNDGMGFNRNQAPYIIKSKMLRIYTPADAEAYEEYCENVNANMVSGDKWFDVILGKTVEEIQAFSDAYSIEYAKSLRG